MKVYVDIAGITTVACAVAGKMLQDPLMDCSSYALAAMKASSAPITKKPTSILTNTKKPSSAPETKKPSSAPVTKMPTVKATKRPSSASSTTSSPISIHMQYYILKSLLTI